MPASVQAWIASETGTSVERVRRLPGASSTAMHRVYLANGTSLVLRRYIWPGFLEDEPVAPQREVDALQFASRHSLPVPDVVASDVAGTQVGDGVPTILMTFLPGRATGDPDLARLAEMAGAIHDVDADDFGHTYFAWYQGTTVRPPATSSRPQLWEAAIHRWTNQVPPYRPAFVHRDFHPGNVLWSRGAVTGTVDWANACRGPWECDVAHCRDNLIELAGVDMADSFLDAYQSMTGRTYDTYWEIASVLEHAPSHWTPERLARSEPRLERALRAVG